MFNGLRRDIVSIRYSRAEQLYEVGVFLFLILPSMVISLFSVEQGVISFPLLAISIILRDHALAGLILFFVWRNGEPLEFVGLTTRDFFNEAALGVLLYVPFMYIVNFFQFLLQTLGVKPPQAPLPSFMSATGMWDLILAIILVTVVAFTEEVIFRGYLMLRFESATASTFAALFLSSFIFAIGHGYEGTLGVITVGFIGIIFALLYLWRRSLVAPMVMHFIQDFIAIIILPLTAAGH
jgi:membrane protease YdiL (CAAX protease family)